jgi:hypothetical protein
MDKCCGNVDHKIWDIWDCAGYYNCLECVKIKIKNGIDINIRVIINLLYFIIILHYLLITYYSLIIVT